jgi:2-polyprenyl-3-methyl-5-hydroxy-6-metoxy-1,4-benzoquinol methylase
MPAVVDPDGVELATIRELVELRGVSVIDVGCGSGRLSRACAGEGARVFAFDPDEELIAAAHAETPAAVRRQIRFEVAHAREIELPKGEFDLALFSWSL